MGENLSSLVDFLPQLGEGIWVTVQLTLAGALGALVIAVVLGMMLVTPFKALTIPARIVVEFFRGTSLLVQLFWLFFVLPLLGISLDPMTCGIMALALNYGAYAAEVVRGSIGNVPAGQWEASRALSLSPTHRMTRVIFPQAWALMIPSLSTLLIQLLKGTAVVSFITLQDLTDQVNQLRQSTGDTFFSYTVGLLVYFVIAWLLTLGMNALEARAKKKLGRGKPAKDVFKFGAPAKTEGAVS